MNIFKFLRELRDKEERGTAAFLERMRQLDIELDEEINRLTVEDARQRAESLLQDTSQFSVAKAAQNDERSLDDFAPILRDFFAQYEDVDQIGGPLRLSRDWIRPTAGEHGLMRIGDLTEEHQELAVMPGEEKVYYIDLEVLYEDGLSERSFATIYHCILYADRLKSVLHSE